MTFPSGWNHKVEFVINPNTSAFTGGVLGLETVITQDSNGFPSTEIFTGNTKARPNGGDIRFTSGSDGNGVLPIDLEQYNQDTSAFVVHVKLPDTFELSGTSQTVYMWWGVGDTWQPEASATTAGSENVWTDYTSVWHMGEVSGTSSLNDSTSARNDGIFTNGNAVPIDGSIGDAQSFVRIGTSAYVDIPNETDYDYTTSLEIECWISAGDLPEWAGIVTKGDGGFRLTKWGTSDNIRFYCNNLTSESVDSTSDPLTATGFNYVVANYDGTTIAIYINGDLESSASSSGTISNVSNNLLIANHPFSNREWDGSIDEVRIGSVVSNSGKIKAQYENINSQSSFVSAGSVQNIGSVFPDDWNNKTKFIINPSTVKTTENVPIRIPSSFITTTMWNNTQDDGGDLRVTSDELGTSSLPLEVVFWDKTTSATEIWVETSVTSGVGGSFYIWYNTSANERQPVEDVSFGRYNVWDENFSMVHHMIWKRSDTAEGKYGFIDSTRNGNNAVDDSFFLPDYETYTSGSITCADDGLGSYFKFGFGNNVSGFDIPDSPSLKIGSDNSLLEAYVRHTPNIQVSADIDQIFQKRLDNSIPNFNFEIQLNESTKRQGSFFTVFEDDTSKVSVSGSYPDPPIQQNKWYYVGGLRSNNVVYTLVDGISGTQSSAFSGDTNSNIPLAVAYDKARYTYAVSAFEFWDGSIDEIRLTSGGDRTIGWIQTQSNILSGSELYTSVENIVSGTGSLTTPLPTLSGTGIVSINGNGLLTTPLLTLSGEGIIGRTSTGNLNIPTPILSGEGIIGRTSTGNLNIHIPVVSGVARVQPLGSGSIIISIPVVSGVARVQPLGSGNLIIPLPIVKGVGDIESDQLAINRAKIKAQLVTERVEEYAYDLDKNILSQGEIINDKAINASIENILSTIRGEKLFSPRFGTILPLVTFEQLNLDSAQELVSILLRDIRRYEKRVTVIKEQVKMDLRTDENSLTIVIPYIINRNGLSSTFARKIVL